MGCRFRFRSDSDVHDFRTSLLESLAQSGKQHRKSHDPRSWFRQGSRASTTSPEQQRKDMMLWRVFSEFDSLMHGGGGDHHHLFFFFAGAPPAAQGVPGGMLDVALRGPAAPVPGGYAAGLVRRIRVLPATHALHDTVAAGRLLRRGDPVPLAHRIHCVVVAVFGRGELIINPYQIARRYLARTFWFDFFTPLPPPKFVACQRRWRGTCRPRQKNLPPTPHKYRQ